MKKSLISGSIIILLFLFLARAGLACTIFYVNTPTTNYFASNEDYTASDPAFRVVPGKPGDYGYLVFGWNSYLPGYPQGGVNEYGICLDWASVPAQKFKAVENRKDLDDDIMYKILKKCRNIDEVITLVKQYNCSHFAEEHLLVSDRNGGSCIIEWSGSDYVFLRKTRDYQLITNFNISNPKLGWYPCVRFKTADDILRNFKGKNLKPEDISDILNKTHQEKDYPTRYSYIVDEKSLDIYIFINHDFSRYTKINLNREIKKGPHQMGLAQ